MASERANVDDDIHDYDDNNDGAGLGMETAFASAKSQLEPKGKSDGIMHRTVWDCIMG